MSRNAIWTRKGPKRALITGASGGIGEAFAHLLAQEGWELVLVARNADELNRVAGVLHGDYAAQVHFLPLDLTAPGAAQKLQEWLAARKLRVDVLINNAGFGLMGPATELPLEEQLRMIDLNCRAATELALTLLPPMMAQRAGGIINVASLAAFMPGPGMAVYHATKAFLLSFSEALVEETRPAGLTITTLCPGPVKTGFQKRARMQGSLLLRLLPSATPQSVALDGWQAFKEGRTLAMPGLVPKLLMFANRLLPRSIIRRTGAILAGVHKNRKKIGRS